MKHIQWRRYLFGVSFSNLNKTIPSTTFCVGLPVATDHCHMAETEEYKTPNPYKGLLKVFVRELLVTPLVTLTIDDVQNLSFLG